MIFGHSYTYRVNAANLMGYGVFSTPQSYIPREAPGKPTSAPTLVAGSSSRTTIVISYLPILENTGGSAIIKYNVYVDDGHYSAFAGPYTSATNGMSMLFSTDLLPVLPTTGLTYRFKYTSVNIAGESILSDELCVLLAEVPTVPLSLVRIDSNILPAGQIRVTWSMPSDNGGSPITGYRLYLDTVLLYDGSSLSTEVVYTIVNLIVGRAYQISVSANNAKGESLT